MSRKFKIYYYFIIILGIAIVFQEILVTKIHRINITGLIIIFTMSVISEILISETNVNTSVTLRGPLTLFSVIYFPLLWIYIMAIGFAIISKSYSTIFKKEYERVFDVKLFFNICQAIIIVKFISIISGSLNFTNYYNSFMWIIILSFLYVTLNLFLVGMVISLYNSKNAFKDYAVKEMAVYYFYFFMISELIYFSYEAYGNLALLFSMFFVLPIQNTILNYYKIDEINKLLITDSLTGAYNRYYLENCINDYIGKNKKFTLIFFDFNDFKRINDEHGHVAGDFVLKNVVKDLKSKFGMRERIFRYGGDEFCIFIDGISREEVIDSGKIEYEEKEIEYSYSTGKFEYSGEENLNFEDIINILDKNMYNNKFMRKSEKK